MIIRWIVTEDSHAANSRLILEPLRFYGPYRTRAEAAESYGLDIDGINIVKIGIEPETVLKILDDHLSCEGCDFDHCGYPVTVLECKVAKDIKAEDSNLLVQEDAPCVPLDMRDSTFAVMDAIMDRLEKSPNTSIDDLIEKLD